MDAGDAIAELAEAAASRFLARYLEETGKSASLHDCTVYKLGYVDGAVEALEANEALGKRGA